MINRTIHELSDDATATNRPHAPPIIASPILSTRCAGWVRTAGTKSRLRKSEQGDKWNFCLTAGKIGPRIRRGDEQTSTPEPHPGFQGEGGACRRQGRPNTGSSGGAVRRPPQSDHIVEGAA